MEATIINVPRPKNIICITLAGPVGEPMINTSTNSKNMMMTPVVAADMAPNLLFLISNTADTTALPPTIKASAMPGMVKL